MQFKPRYLSLLVLAGPLMACSTAAQQQFVAINNGLQAAIAQAKACTAEVRARPEFDAIRLHLADKPIAAELADTALPTVTEAELVKHYTVSVDPCITAFRAQLGATEPAAASAVDQYFFDQASIHADLIMRKITWADAARREQAVKSQDGPAIRQAHEATMQSLAAQHRRELAERQEFSDRLVTGLANAAAIYAITHPAPPPPPIVSGPSYCNGHVDQSGNIQANCY
jgi:hypothetical protein